MATYFNIQYEFDREAVHKAIEEQVLSGRPDYICVCDGVILNTANRKEDYLEVINGGMFSICDSSFVPLYINWIHGHDVNQYAGSEIFMDIVSSRKYRMIFLGTNTTILEGLRKSLIPVNPAVADMKFVELPFRDVEEFDYQQIADEINRDGAEIVWVALGAPKQEYFMSHLKGHLNRGVMIAVGAAFKFFSGVESKRAPGWMVRNHMEFVYRIGQEPKKQLRRCFHIVRTLPGLLFAEWRRGRLGSGRQPESGRQTFSPKPNGTE